MSTFIQIEPADIKIRGDIIEIWIEGKTHAEIPVEVMQQVINTIRPADLPEAGASAERISSVVRRLPEYNEIDQVANDEASGIDWNKLEYSGIYTDGFIAGALWMKSIVKQ